MTLEDLNEVVKFEVPEEIAEKFKKLKHYRTLDYIEIEIRAVLLGHSTDGVEKAVYNALLKYKDQGLIPSEIQIEPIEYTDGKLILPLELREWFNAFE